MSDRLLDAELDNTGYYPNNGSYDPAVLAVVDALDTRTGYRAKVTVRQGGIVEIDGPSWSEGIGAILSRYSAAEIVAWATGYRNLSA